MATTFQTNRSKRARAGERGFAHSSYQRPATSGNNSSAKASCQQRTRRRTRKTSDAAPTSDQLSSYFRDLSEHDLLTPEQEKEMARGIEENEVRAWEVLLTNPAVADYVLDFLEMRLDSALQGFRSVRKATALVRKSSTKGSRAKLHKIARAVAEKLRALDLDRVHMEAVMAHFEELRVGLSRHRKTKLPFSQNTRAFTEYMDEIRDAYDCSARLRSDFVHANLRLVVTMARRYDHGGLPLADLIQEGNLGLMHAVSRFDYRRGLRFSTYACWWIRHAIGRALADKSRAVRIPVHMLEAQQQLQKVQQQLTSELGRKPTSKELAKAAKMPVSKLNQMHHYLMGQPMSLDRPVHDEDDRAFGELITDPATEEATAEDHLNTRALARQVEELMSDLSPIEADVLRQRFGLRDDNERTFREIGDQYQLSRERIRQIQNTALGKLRRALERVL
jgi:RNA polymerase primary sigma factor